MRLCIWKINGRSRSWGRMRSYIPYIHSRHRIIISYLSFDSSSYRLPCAGPRWRDIWLWHLRNSVWIVVCFFFSGAERSASKTRSHRVYCAHNCFHVRLRIQTTKFNIENNAIIFTENICSIGVWQQTMFARLRLGSCRFFSSVRQEILGETFSSFWMADKVCLAQMHTKLKLLIFAARL